MPDEMPIPQDPPDAGRVLLRDGRVAALRRLSAADGEAVRQFLGRLSTESLADRFLATLRPSAATQALMVPGSGEGGVALGVEMAAESGSGTRIIAIGSYTPSGAPPGRAELALAVEDDQQGRGLGTLLLERLALLARREGLAGLVAQVRPGNHRILEVLRTSGLPMTTRSDGGSLVVDLGLTLEPAGTRLWDARDRQATVASLTPAFRPGSIAVVGASRRPTAIGRRILENLVRGGFTGRLYPVNPHADRIGDLPAVPSPADLPEVVDLAILAVPASGVLEAAEACGRAGVRSLVVISAGFAEAGPEGRRHQDALADLCRHHGMRLIGPNCLGILNTDPAVRMNASFSPIFPPAGPMAMSSQSGALGLALLDYARQQGIGVSSFVSVGNKADVSGNDLLQYWEDDPATQLIVLYLESFGNPRRFARIARRVGRAKPVLVVKAGRSPAGRKAAGSHTAALAASETAVSALFAQTGVIRADTLEELFDVAGLLARQPLPAGPRVAVLTNAGGPAILAADALSASGLELPAPSAATVAALRAILPPEASLANPVDMIASASADQYARSLAALLADPGIDMVLVIFVPVGGETSAAVMAAVERTAQEAQAMGQKKPVAMCLMDTPPEASPLPVYRFPEPAARALGKAQRYARWREQDPGRMVDLPGMNLAAARGLVERALAEGREWLAPDQAVALLGHLGIPTVPVAVAATPEEAALQAEQLGLPVAVKMVSSTLIHKTEWRGVRLGLADGEAVRQACREIQEGLARAGRAADLEGFLVQPMAPSGSEWMVGATVDPLFGPLVAFGVGGTEVEVLADVVLRLTPLTDRDAQEMLASIRAQGLLLGSRGRPGADRQALAEVLLRVSRLVEELPQVAELDLNPVIAGAPGSGCRVVDARIRVATG